VGQALGGPWTWIGPAAGFGVGLLADMKMMKGFHQKAGARQAQSELRAKADADSEAPGQGAAAAPAAGSGACCGIASGLTRMFEKSDKNEKGEMTLAEIGKTYQTGSGEPAQEAQPAAAGTVANAEAIAVQNAKST
jgi:hypothetical protein